ncbi:apolipoprotein D-like [Ischnura elegans]|uniref:apolipoprotein D-like n=1 Tax=Ischnura elegans TaxID=197161 RepID=UPI001ED86F9E|nr:apolipoprotein D-like [Ischnura elegans]
MIVKMISVVVLFAVLHTAWSHTYHLGSCPQIEAMPNFQMNKFLGKWYVIQKTSTASKCIYYNFTTGEEPGEYRVIQASEHFLLGLTNVDHAYVYTGALRMKNHTNPADMTVRFPLSVAGSASYKIIATDYDNFATVFTCQRLAFAHRQSTSILSRTPVLDRMYIDKARTRLNTLGIDPHDLSIIEQSNCRVNASGDGVKINIDEDTLTPGSVAGVVRRAGDVLGDGIEAAAMGAKKVYHTLASSTAENERISSPDSDAEWLP